MIVRLSQFALAAAAVMLGPIPLVAQRRHAAEEWLERCRDRHSDRDERHCEVREFRMTGESLVIDAHPNGGIEVEGWDRNEIRVEARIQTEARTLGEAEDLAKEIRIEARDGQVSSNGPESSGRRSWSLSYTVYVPWRTDLRLITKNGGVRVDGVTGRLDLQTHNGGVHLSDVGGDVRARARNGGLRVELGGQQWEGVGLLAETDNGGIDLSVPDGYSAELEASTQNGGLEVDFPVTVTGRIGRRIVTTLGRGGPPVKVSTHNGGIRVRRS